MSTLRKGRWSTENFVIDSVIYGTLIIVVIITLYPFLNMLAVSFNDSLDTSRGGVGIWPREFTTYNYENILKDNQIYSAALISILRTLLTTVFGVFFCLMLAYLLSRKDFVLRKFLTTFLVMTMYFSGGLIPIYFVMKWLGLTNSFWVYVIPNLVGAFYVIVMRTYIEGLPESLIESAKIDGAGDFRIMIQIIVPLTLPVIATVALFIAVQQWNSWFDTFLYNSSKKSLSTLQYELMKKLMQATQVMGGSGDYSSAMARKDTASVTPQSIRATMTIIATLPILFAYPFLQKYFVTGLTLGGVKG